MSNTAPEQHQEDSGYVLIKALAFSFSLVLVFTAVANLLPQVEGEAPVEQEVDVNALDMDSFVALGEKIFHNKGTCILCHNERGRAPDLLALNISENTATHLQDIRYDGQATDTESYLRESMLEPGKYVVKGYGKKGSNDTISPMPRIDRPPIQLSPVEIDAVIAFLQSKDGGPVTVQLPSTSDTNAAVVDTANTAVASALPATANSAEEVIAKYMCTACHSILASDSPVGPELHTVGARLSVDDIRQSILQPDAVVHEGFPAGVMPRDFAEKMTVKELDLLVTYLAGQKE